MIGDRLKGALEAFVRRLVAAHVYHPPYTARIVSQAGDGSLEVQPDDARLPSLTGVPLRTFVPGVELKVKPGGHVLVQFENGDPSRPVATLFDGGAVESLKITASTKIVVDAAEVDLVSAGGLPLARQGDMVYVTIPIGVVTQGAGSSSAPNAAPIPLYGTITSGNPTRKA